MAVDEVMIGEGASFFADLQALASLVCHVVPVVMARRSDSQTIRIWSAGCSTGQPTYSLVMTLSELCPALSNWNVQIVASDPDGDALARAKRGIFGASEAQRGLPTEWLLRHFEELPEGGGWRIRSPLSERIAWLELDPSRSCRQVGTVDVILCHQPLSRMDSQCAPRRASLERMTGQLSPHGFLIVRSSVPGLDSDPRFERAFCTYNSVIYRRLPLESSLLSA
jgi:chemotaxis protein methyltransferase CheR